jgi:hypothetical protein
VVVDIVTVRGLLDTRTKAMGSKMGNPRLPTAFVLLNFEEKIA